MSEQRAVPRRPAGGGHGPMAGMMPAEKSMHFGASSKRLIRMMRPDRARAFGILALGLVSVALQVIGPKILGRANTQVERLTHASNELSKAGYTFQVK